MKLSEIQTIILCGGLGTRLRDLYPELPKALVPVASKPFIERQIEWLFQQGIRKIHLAAGYKAKLLQNWLEKEGKEKFFDIQFSFSEEPEPLGTGGGLVYAINQLKVESFFVFNGDTLLPSILLKDFLEFSYSTHFDITIATVKIENAARFGTITFNEKNKSLISFNEKMQQGSGWINAGIYLFKSFKLDGYNFGKKFSIEKDFFPELVKEGRIGVFNVAGKLFDMGTPEGIKEMEALFLGEF